MEELSKVIAYLSANWAFFLFAVSLLFACLGRIVFKVSLLQPLEEIAHRQNKYRKEAQQEGYKKEMVERHLELGYVFLDLCQLDAARAEFESAINLDQLNVEAQKGLFKAKIFQPILSGDYDPEVYEKRLQSILKENNNDKHALIFLGNIYLKIDCEKALAYFRLALDQDPSLAVAYTNIGYVCDIQNKCDEALSMHEKAACCSPWNQTILNNLGYHYVRKGQYKQAVYQLEKLLRLEANILIAYWNLFTAYWMLGKVEDAYCLQQKLLDLVVDENVLELRRNTGMWFFKTDIDGVMFENVQQKQCYSYYATSLSAYMLSKIDDANLFAKKARAFNQRDQFPGRKLLLTNIEKLNTEQHILGAKLREFRLTFFSD